jgi:hypothetical protein
METSPFFDPRVLIPLGIAIVGLIAWFIRLEAKNQANAVEVARLERELTEIWKEFETHRLNQDIHFNVRVSNQVEQGNERRFGTIERQLTEINTKLDRLAEKK